jgi:hypothetical protein
MDKRTVVSAREPGFVSKIWEKRDRASRWLARQLVPNLGTLLLVGILLWVSGVYAAPDSASPAQLANTSFTTVNYQGRLADASGTPINDTVSLTFALYEAETGSTAVWSESHGAVPVSDGLFSVRLGQIAPLSTDLLTENLWLEIQVDTDPPMTPREKLAAVPYAMQAKTALTVLDGSITTEKIADGAVTSAKLDTGLCCGHTNMDGLGWADYGDGISIYIDTSACNFATIPMYFTSLAGNTHHWKTTGATSIYVPSANGFEVYLDSTIETLDPAKADSWDWYIQWCGVRR